MPMKSSYPKLHSVKMKRGWHDPKVEVLPTASRDFVDPEDVLYGAYQEGLYDVVVFGYNSEGREYLAMSTPDVGRAHYMLSRGAQLLLKDAEE